MEDNTYQTLELDISRSIVSVSSSKSTGIEVEATKRNSHVELVFKLPHIDQKLGFQCKNDHMSDIVDELQFVVA